MADTQTLSQTDRLIGMVHDENPFELPFDDVRECQLEAIQERFAGRVDKIKLLQNRAEAGSVQRIETMEDIVPLLFAHTAYKSYPESWLIEAKWDRMGKWLDTISTNRVAPLGGESVAGLDDWLARLEEQGHYVSCSSGTTGKCAMMNATRGDLDYAGLGFLESVVWTGLKPNHDRMVITCGQVAFNTRNVAVGQPMVEALMDPGVEPFRVDADPITIGSITEMVVLRKKMAEGTALPADIAKYESEVAARQIAVESVIDQAVEAIIANRDRKLHFMGLFGPMYQVAARVRERGFGGKDFAENTIFISGGLKRAQVPDNYQDIVFDTLNITPERACHTYGMQELNTSAPRCSHGRYHVAPWVMLLLLDESGEKLIPIPASGEVEGRAGYFDLSLDGRWGGVISGDKVRATWEPCACGNRSPSIHSEIQRYADMASGDKIACSGTIDAYVRGIA